MIAEIIPEKRTSPDKNTFSYSIPRNLESQVKIGSICEISFGKKMIRGIISNMLVHPEKINCHLVDPGRAERSEGSPQIDSSATPQNDKKKYKLKEVLSIDHNFTIPKTYLEIAKWISEYYLCSTGEAITLFLPPKISRPRQIKVISSRLSVVNQNIKLNSEQKEVFERLKKKLDYCSSTFGRLSVDSARTKELKSSQSPMAQSNNNIALLHGVTGSGKTEVYIKLTEEVLRRNKQAIILTPEIMLTPQIVERFEQSFPGQICLMHSGLSQSERYLSYKQFATGDKPIIIGPRSALLVPSENIGLIIIDEEQEDAYKQEKDPRYHAVALAEQIAKKNNALLLLGSATPRIESFYRTQKDNRDPRAVISTPQELRVEKSSDKRSLDHARDDIEGKSLDESQYDLYELKNRYQKLILPTSKVVDLKDEIKKDNFSPVSEELQKNISEVLKNKREIILFLNRRGMSTFVSCRECGEVIMCPNCSIPMVYHVFDKKHTLNCHHCDYKTNLPSKCPNCQSLKIKYFGAGIDKIVAEIEKLFPKARIKKVDSKSLSNKNDYMKLYEDIKNRKIDILIGTQILAKGLDIPTVDLVGIISADVGLHLPYYKANEKTFSLITQVSGRSGRKDNSGRTIIQTYWPESNAIQLAAIHDYHTFYEKEIQERKTYNYPPFCHLVRVVSEDKNEQNAKKEILDIAEKLKKKEIDIIGPAKCFLSRINNKYRYHLIIKTTTLPDPKIAEIYKTNPYLVWDVDPADLL